MNTTERVSPEHLAAIREAKTRVELARTQLEVAQLRACAAHGLAPGDVFDDGTGVVTRAPKPAADAPNTGAAA